MGLFDKLGKAINRKPFTINKKSESKAEPASKKAKLSPKEQATKDKEPWFTIVDVEIDKDNPRNGAFELDWNEYFVEMLRKHGLTGQTNEEIIDRWFQDLCKQIALESYDEEVFEAHEENKESTAQEKEKQKELLEDGKREYK